MQIIDSTTAVQLVSSFWGVIESNITGLLLLVGTIFAISFVMAFIDEAMQNKLNKQNEGRGFNGRKLR